MPGSREIDRRALKLLLKYDASAEDYKRHPARLHPLDRAYMEKHGTSAADFEYMKEKGLAFDCVTLHHDEAVDRCFEFMDMLDKRSVTDGFLASLSSATLDYRSGLGAYAIMQSMPRHRYTETPARFCEICCAQREERCLDLTQFNFSRHQYGAMIGGSTPYEIQFFLYQDAMLAPVQPTADDFEVFNLILTELSNAHARCKPVEMRKILRKIPGFAATLDQSTGLLETLGFCSILESDRHKGYLHRYTKPGLAPSKSRSSDWAYPVDFWTGADGVNRDALQFWFGEYAQIRLV